MSNIDDIRIEMTENETSMESPLLSEAMKELDSRIMDANTWTTVTYTLGFISKIEYFSDAAKTKKTIQRDFTRSMGSDGINYIVSIVTTTYNDNASIDSTITTTLTRTDNKITACASSFATSEVLI